MLIEAATIGDVSSIKALIASGVDVDSSENNTTALIEASRIGHFAVVRLILEAGAAINLVNKDGSSALMVCIPGGYVDVVEVLLAKGADVNISDKHGYTALIDASLHGHSELVNLLLDAGADPRQRNEDGVSALDCAKTVEIRNAIENHVMTRKLRDRTSEAQKELQTMKDRVNANYEAIKSNESESTVSKDRAELLASVFVEFSVSCEVNLSEIALQQIDVIEANPHLKEYHDCFRRNLLCASYVFLCCTAAAGLCGSLNEFPSLLGTAAVLFREPVVTYLAEKLCVEDHILSVMYFALLSEQQAASPLQFIDQLARELTLVQRVDIERVAATALRAHDTMLEHKQQVSLWLTTEGEKEEGQQISSGVKTNVQIKAVVDVKRFLDNLLSSSSPESEHTQPLKFDSVELMIQLALGLTDEETSINGILLCDALKQIRILETQSVISLTEITAVCDSEIDSNAGNNERDVDEVARLMAKHRRDVCCVLM